MSQKVSFLKRWREKQPFLVIVALIAIQIIIFYLLYYNPTMQEKVFTPLVNLYASLSASVINLLGFNCGVYKDTIFSMQFSVGIRKGCDALEPMALLVAGIIAFPSTVKQKVIGVLLGLTALFVLNIIRIVTLFLTGIYYPKFFEAMHIEVWQIIFILIGIGFLFLWIRWVVKHKPKAE